MGYNAIAHDTHKNLGWRRPEGYQFAASDLYCHISISELKSSFWRYPTVFVKTNEEFALAALLGCQENQNLFVSKEGKWISDTVPIVYSNHPFKLAKDKGKGAKRQNEKLKLCIDKASEQPTAADNEPFFTPDGKLTEVVSHIANQLVLHREDFIATDRLCKKISELDLIVPWQATVHLATQSINLEGLNCVDADRLKKLSGKELKELMTADALPLIYMHLQSMQNLSIFKVLIEAHERWTGTNTEKLRELNFNEIQGSGNISLENLDGL